jgi:threonine/homoserine/homoserine lactone efflux protein
MFAPLLIGFLFGFFGAIPVAGPISALVLRCGLKKQYPRGRSLAMGAGLAEAIYVLLAFFGFNMLLKSAPWLESTSQWLACILLIGLGIYFIISRKTDWIAAPQSKRDQKGSGFLIGFGISIANPTLIATWTTVITSLHGMRLFDFSTLASLSFSMGVWTGITGWFVLMLWVLKKNHEKLQNQWIQSTMLFTGSFLILLGIITAKSAFH